MKWNARQLKAQRTPYNFRGTGDVAIWAYSSEDGTEFFFEDPWHDKKTRSITVSTRQLMQMLRSRFSTTEREDSGE